MIRLLLLGNAGLTGGAKNSARVLLSQPKRLGVLTYLTLARPRGLHRRDRILALFWPELDQSHGRAALRQTLYVLRRALGDGVIVARGDEEVGVDPERLWCDAVAFEDALERGSPEAALELYRGHLLLAYHLPRSSPAFEKWLESERRRLRRRAAKAARRLADEAEVDGEYRRAAEWALRETELSPFDEDAFRHRLVLLDRAGDRASACAEYDTFALRLQQELLVDPSPETQAIIAGVRARQRASSPDDGAPDDGAPDDDREPEDDASGRERRPRARRTWIAALGTLVLAAGLVWAAARGGGAASGVENLDPRSVAVLPFEALGGESDESYLAAGLTAELSAALASVRELVVVSPLASDLDLSGGHSAHEVGAELGAAHLLHGSLRRDGDRLRIVAELVHVPSGELLWAEAYDRDRSNLLAVQAELAEGIVSALRPRLTSTERARLDRRLRAEPAAYDLYLAARELIPRSPASNAAAIEMLREAIDLDPGFAPAHAALSNAYLQRVQMGSSAEWADSGVAAARRALALDPELAEGYRELGANLSWQGRLEEAVESLRRAVRINPSYGEAFLGLGVMLAWKGRLDEALEQYERALVLIPGNPITPLQIGTIFVGLQRYDDAERWLAYALELRPAHLLTLQLLTLNDLARGDPESARARVDLMLALDSAHHRSVNAAADVALFAGRIGEAREQLERFHAARPAAPAGGVFLSPGLRHGYALVRNGEMDRGREILQRVERSARAALQRGDERYSVPLELAAIHAIRGEVSEAVEWLEAAVRAGFRMPAFVTSSPLFEPLRGDPAYEAVMTSLRWELDRIESRIPTLPATENS